MTTRSLEGWDTIRVGDYFHSWGGMTPSTNNASYWGGRVPWVSSKDVKGERLAGGEDFITQKALEETSLRLCPVGSVLVVVRSGILAHTLPIAVADAPVSINQDLKAFYCADNDMNEWLALALRALTPEILTNNRKDGTTVQSVRYEELCDLTIPVPPSAEQRRITARVGDILQKVRNTIERISKVPAILKRFRQAVLSAACSGRLTDDWRSEQARMEPWKQVCLGEVADSRLGKMLDQARNVGVPISYLRNTNLRWFCFDLTDLSQMRATPQDVKEFSIKDGDLLVCEGGEPGRCAVWNRGSNDLIFQKAIHRIRLNGEVSPHWVAFNIKNDAASGELEQYFTGSGIKHLTGRSLATYSLQLPPLEEQLEIVRRIDALFKLADTIEIRVATAARRADKLTQSILAKAFRGELVPSEAELARREGREYESASVLLERIRANRADQASVPARRRKPRKASAHV